MGWQPTYQTEGHIYRQIHSRPVPDAKIGVLYQNDEYGKDYVKGLKDGARRQGEEDDRARVRATRSTDPTIDLQIVSLQASGANVFYDVTIPSWRRRRSARPMTSAGSRCIC